MSYSVFHINCNFIFTELYSHLFDQLSQYGISQKVWIPHKKYHIPRSIEKIENVDFLFTGYQDFFDRFFFRRKIKKGLKIFDDLILPSDASIIHAHTLYSDGALAYELKLKYGIPYIVSIRNTDLNIFWKYFPHLRNYGRKIVEGASSVVFLGNSYKERMVNSLFPMNSADGCSLHVQVIPNGIDPFWLNNMPKEEKVKNQEIKVLFVGEFNKNKNIVSIIKACRSLKKEGWNVRLRLVGGQGKNHVSLGQLDPWIEIIPFCQNKKDLAIFYRWADVFVMPSFTETFGLVYAEALSQGTPVVFTRNQGFDGWVENGICGCCVDPQDIDEIVACIKHLHKESFMYKCIEASKIFSWESISKKYMFLYENALL